MNPGQGLSHYRIVQRLGAGGMGEVYKALDTKLNRTVAIKVLPAEFVSNPERRRRFIQEAQAASALDHPNIVTIHDISEADGRHFIVMQYVKGRTLRELVQEGIDISKSFDYAAQMADGLSAAHAAGIVHRDLKPENVLIDEKGWVKILDFGLAKLTEPEDVHEAETRDRVRLTREGHILGTAAYMSPEQAQGKQVDARSDIFSFGSVLYEMLTGKQAFEGDNLASVMAAIIRDNPPPVTGVLPTAPLGIDGFLRRCLEKDPAKRFSSMEEVKTELETVRSSPRGARHRRSMNWRWLGTAAALVLIGSLFYALEDKLGPQPPQPLPVTSYPDYELCPVLSPDGSRVAFLMNPDGRQPDDIYVQNISGGNALQLTDTSDSENSLAWTPDGQRITFLRPTDGGQDIYSVPALGGAESRIASVVGVQGAALGLSWSPDGQTLAYVDRERADEPLAIFFLDMETGERTKITSPPADYWGDRNPIFSPEGHRVAFIRMATGHIHRDIFIKDLKDGDEMKLTSEKAQILGLDWVTDGRSIIYSSDRQGAQTLYRIAASGGLRGLLRFFGIVAKPRQVDRVVGRAFWPSVARTRPDLVYQQSTEDWNIWRAPGPRSEGGEPKKLFGSTRLDGMPEYSPDGTRIAFVSDRSGSTEIWICDSDGNCDRDGNNPVRLTWFDKYVHGARWSPDGGEIAFAARLEDHTDVFRMSAAGGIPVRLTKESSNDGMPSWSRNGDWIYFMSDRSGSGQIWKMTVDGEDTTQLTRNGGSMPLESLDGAFVYFNKMDPGEGIWRVPSSGGLEELVLAGALRWALVEGGIAYINEATREFEFFDFDSGTKTPFASPTGPLQTRGGGLSVSPDGLWLLYPQGTAGEDIVMLKNLR